MVNYTLLNRIRFINLLKFLKKLSLKDSGTSLNSSVRVNGLSFIKSVTPSIGSLNGGSFLTIIGNGFTTSTSVLIGLSNCSITQVTLDQLVCMTSSHAAGIVNFMIKLAYYQIKNYLYQF